MNRVVLAVLGVVFAVAMIVTIARESSDGKKPRRPAPKPAPALRSPAPAPEAGAEGREMDDAELEVKELSFGDGSANQRSIRVEHPSLEMQKRLREWLEPRESAAVASRAALDCHAELARMTLVSVVCVTMPAPDGDAGADAGDDAGASSEDAGEDAMLEPGPATSFDAPAGARYEALTLRTVNDTIKELSLQDVLAIDAGQGDVIAACKKTASTPAPCVWPPTTFALGPEGALVLCHDNHCVRMQTSDLVRPELR